MNRKGEAMYRVAVSLAALVVIFATSSVVGQQKKGDHDLLEGKWLVKKMTKRGKTLQPDAFKGEAFTFSKGRMTIASNDRTFRFAIDAAKKPKQLDLTAEDGPFKGQTLPGIYQLDGKTLVLCLPHDKNTERPDAFESKGNGAPSRILYHLERAKE